MKLTALETIRDPEATNLLWVFLHGEGGLIGFGETFRGAAAVEAHLHDQIWPHLQARHPFDLERISTELLRPYVGSRSSGAEIRAASAVDIALWDLFAQAKGEPLWRLLGGLAHDHVATYNTCAGPRYNASGGRRAIAAAEAPIERYDDQIAFMRDAGALAKDLLAEGIRAMKIWPFDPAAGAFRGQALWRREIAAAEQAVAAIRDAVGHEMEILIECHALFEPPAARTIAEAIRPYGIFWMEDPIRNADPKALADFRRMAGVPVTASETFAGRAQFLDVLRADAVDYAMLDIAWCGGLTEARKIAALTDAFQRPVAPHDCTGPVVYAASLHLAFATPNCVFQESVRAYYRGWYAQAVTGLPLPSDGRFAPPTELGHGVRPKADWLARPSLLRRISRR
ncbi:MAG: mandelate racemase/muconate lactonizing enzyme family protein [Geminicoccaceae bacterium]|nr:MAG: mandelate racemase/muconate lactonizing enzyme family protein [Geminicoccaceae bacterium]